MAAYTLSAEQVDFNSFELATNILKVIPKKDIVVFGIPNGGSHVAFQVVKHLGIKGTLTYNIDEADVIVDDIVDSGETMKRYAEKSKAVRAALISVCPEFTNNPKNIVGLSLEKGTWVVFPWESSEVGSALDIPKRMLQYIGENPDRAGLIETPQRVVKAWGEWFSGYAQKPEDIMKVFEDGAESYDEMVLVSNIPVYSKCEHHMADIFGIAHVAYIPNGKIVGLSKMNRLVNVFARRLQVQERLTVQIADAINNNLSPLGVGVVLQCRHMCMESRGITTRGSITTTSAMRGVFHDDSSTRAEFLRLIESAKNGVSI